jgi:hypothetical protein
LRKQSFIANPGEEALDPASGLEQRLNFLVQFTPNVSYHVIVWR